MCYSRAGTAHVQWQRVGKSCVQSVECLAVCDSSAVLRTSKIHSCSGGGQLLQNHVLCYVATLKEQAFTVCMMLVLGA